MESSSENPKGRGSRWEAFPKTQKRRGTQWKVTPKIRKCCGSRWKSVPKNQRPWIEMEGHSEYSEMPGKARGLAWRSMRQECIQKNTYCDSSECQRHNPPQPRATPWERTDECVNLTNQSPERTTFDSSHPMAGKGRGVEDRPFRALGPFAALWPYNPGFSPWVEEGRALGTKKGRSRSNVAWLFAIIITDFLS